MFEAFVLVCMIGNANLCHTLQDLEGPYETRQECVVRTYEMAADLPEYMPMFQALKYKCFNSEDDEGKVRTQWHMKTGEQPYSRNTDSRV